MATKIGNYIGFYSCENAYFQGIDGQNSLKIIPFSGELEVLPNCVNASFQVYKINGSFYNPNGGFHPCGSPFFSLQNTEVFCNFPNPPMPNRLRTGRSFECQNGWIEGVNGQGFTRIIEFSGILELEEICDNAAFDAIKINGTTWYNPGNLFRACGSPVFALKNIIVTCEPQSDCECCRTLLPLMRVLKV
ncbi:MAG: hypothetical protein AAFS06_05195 [Cyanobacteria bacterium J06631_12]